jgi:hypothetical protein
LLVSDPQVEDVQVSISYTGADEDHVIQYVHVQSIDAAGKTIEIAVKLSTAAGEANTGKLIVWVEL